MNMILNCVEIEVDFWDIVNIWHNYYFENILLAHKLITFFLQKQIPMKIYHKLKIGKMQKIKSFVHGEKKLGRINYALIFLQSAKFKTSIQIS